MKSVIRWMVLILLAVLAIAGICHGLHREEPVTTAGSSAGLGLMLLEREAGLYVLAVTQGSPAEMAGIQPGDYVLQAEDQQLAQSAQLDELIDADTGSLNLELRRDGQLLRVSLPTR